MRHIKGDLVKLASEGRFDVLVHSCNCFHVMGGGIARQIRQVFPEAYAADCRTKHGSRYKLGDYSSHEYPSGLTIVNAYTQHGFGTVDGPAVEYDAFEAVMLKIAKDFESKEIGIPYLISCGLAGGDWNKIYSILSKSIPDATLVELEF